MSERLSFREYQRLAALTDQTSDDALSHNTIPLLGLAGEVGSLLTEYKKFLRDGERYRPFTDEVSEEIGDVLWYLASIARKAGLDLEEVAQENLAKISERWPSNSNQERPNLLPVVHRYDSSFRKEEQLPVSLRVEFREITSSGRTTLQMVKDGVPIGDPLTDNSHIDDGYRYHDVFHLTNTIMLGWSPVTRSLLRLKRKSHDRTDEIEDGARAAVTEEAISALVFGYARDYSFFDGVHSVDFNILRTIRTMARPFEVRDSSYRDWERTILSGYHVWRQMIVNHGGIFVGDASTTQVSYEPLADDS